VVPIVLLVSAGRWERTRAHTCVHARAGVLTRKQFPPARKTEEVEVRRMHARNRRHPGPSCTCVTVRRGASARRMRDVWKPCTACVLDLRGAGLACRTWTSHE